MTGESESFVCCGDWQLVREIGRGAYGVVYLAEGADGAWAAVKVCRRDDVGVERYERELRGAKLYRAIPAPEADTGAKLFMAWWRILNKATDEDPRRRYQSAKALLKGLERLRWKIAMASIAGTRIAKVAIIVAAFAIVAIVVSVVVNNGRSRLEPGQSMQRSEMMYERSIRESFGNILTEARIKELAKKAMLGEELKFTPAERNAFRENLRKDFGWDELPGKKGK